MEPPEGARFLLRRGGLAAGDQVLAEQISRAVDGLPLALDQAGAFIQETPSSPDEYLTLYRTEGAQLRKRQPGISAQHASVTVTFSLAFSRLVEKSPAGADIVRACAFLAPDAIPEEVVTLPELRGKPLDFLVAVQDAGRFALLRRNATAKTLEMHRQVQEVIKDQMDTETRRLWAVRVLEALDGIFPSPEFRNWPQCEALLPHARVAAGHVSEFGLESQSAARLLNKTAYYLNERAEYPEAERLYLRALAIREKALGPDHPDTANSLNNLALLYDNQGRYDDAEPLYQRALAIREKVLGPDHPKTATSLNNLAALYVAQSRYDEAEPLYRRALAIREKALGPDHPDTATSLNNLALLYKKQGRYEQAEPLYQRALAIREKALGPDHPDIATSLNNLAGLYDNQGRYEQAEPLYQRALAIREKALGPDHPDTANSLNNLAVLYDNQGRYDDAEPLYQRALAIFEKALGPDHPDTITANRNYTVFLQERARHDEAKAIEARRGGKQHPPKPD
jgi:tetratricopeptide (TPR) repeat protein